MATTVNVKEPVPPSSDKTHKEKTFAGIPASDSDSGLGGFTGINERALLRKMDRKLLPAVTVLYLLSFLDRSNGRSCNT